MLLFQIQIQMLFVPHTTIDLQITTKIYRFLTQKCTVKECANNDLQKKLGIKRNIKL